MARFIDLTAARNALHRGVDTIASTFTFSSNYTRLVQHQEPAEVARTRVQSIEQHKPPSDDLASYEILKEAFNQAYSAFQENPEAQHKVEVKSKGMTVALALIARVLPDYTPDPKEHWAVKVGDCDPAYYGKEPPHGNETAWIAKTRAPWAVFYRSRENERAVFDKKHALPPAAKKEKAQ